MVIPIDYLVQKFYQYAGQPKYNRLTRTHQGCCPVCREGHSWGKKKRCYYVLDDNVICCHNCGWYSQPVKWIETVGNMNYDEILKESKSFDILPLDILKEDEPCKKVIIVPKLPKDSINLFDMNQLNYYKNNAHVRAALSLIKKRRLYSAINRPDSLWISLTDKTHKNRLIIPFYNECNEIIFYQSRTINEKDLRLYPKYLSKINSEKSLFGLNNVSPDKCDHVFIFEGPIDAFFIQNGIAVAGIQENSNNTFTHLQSSQLLSLKLLEKIWVLDSQWLDTASRKKTERLLKQGETVFIWPESLGKSFKDFNEYCIVKNLDSIEPSFIKENSYAGLKGELMMVNINRYQKK